MLEQMGKSLQTGDTFTSDNGETWYMITGAHPLMNHTTKQITYRARQVNSQGAPMSGDKLITLKYEEVVIVKI